MIYFTYGTDTQKVKQKARDITTSLLARKPDAHLTRLESSAIGEDILNECVGSNGLFARRCIVEMADLLEEDCKDLIIEWLKPLAESENIFVWRERKVNKKTVGIITKHAEKVQIFDTTASTRTTPRKSGDIFGVAQAYGEKNKKQLWLLFTEQMKENVPAEEVHGVLHWQVRVLLAVLMHPSLSAKDLSFKPFTYNKAKQYARNYAPGEVLKHSRELIHIYHNARLGGAPLQVELERWILKL